MTPERLQEIRHRFEIGEVGARAVGELIAEVDRLRAENEQLASQSQGHTAEVLRWDELNQRLRNTARTTASLDEALGAL